MSMKIRKSNVIAIIAAGIGVLLVLRGRAVGEPPPPPPPPDNPQTPPFGLVLQELGYTGSVSIYRTQWSATSPRYGVRVRQLTGSSKSLICFVLQPTGKIETFRAYSNVSSGTIKEFSFSANMTVPEQVGAWVAILYGSPDATISSTAYVGKVAQLIAEDVQEIVP